MGQISERAKWTWALFAAVCAALVALHDFLDLFDCKPFEDLNGCIDKPRFWMFLFFAVAVALVALLLRGRGKPAVEGAIDASDADIRARYLELARKDLQNRLHNSLLGALQLDLGLDTRSDSVRPRIVLREGTSHYAHLEEAFVEHNRRLLVLGVPGAGKTTALLDLGVKLAEGAIQDPTRPLPILIGLNELAQGIARSDAHYDRWARVSGKNKAKLDLVARIHDQISLNPSRKFTVDYLRTLFDSGQAVLLLDGLDEVPASARAELLEQLNRELLIAYGGLSVVVTSRIAEYEELLGREQKLRLDGAVVVADLDAATVDRYLAAPAAKELRHAFAHDPKLYELASTPLILAMMLLAAKHHDPVRQPQAGSRRVWWTNLMDAFIDGLLERAALRNPRASVAADLGKARAALDKLLGWLAREMSARDAGSVAYPGVNDLLVTPVARPLPRIWTTAKSVVLLRTLALSSVTVVTSISVMHGPRLWLVAIPLTAIAFVLLGDDSVDSRRALSIAVNGVVGASFVVMFEAPALSLIRLLGPRGFESAVAAACFVQFAGFMVVADMKSRPAKLFAAVAPLLGFVVAGSIAHYWFRPVWLGPTAVFGGVVCCALGAWRGNRAERAANLSVILIGAVATYALTAWLSATEHRSAPIAAFGAVSLVAALGPGRKGVAVSAAIFPAAALSLMLSMAASSPLLRDLHARSRLSDAEWLLLFTVVAVFGSMRWASTLEPKVARWIDDPITWSLLRLRGAIPASPRKFLRYAEECLVLHRQGSALAFAHLLLRDHFAMRDLAGAMGAVEASTRVKVAEQLSERGEAAFDLLLELCVDALREVRSAAAAGLARVNMQRTTRLLTEKLAAGTPTPADLELLDVALPFLDSWYQWEVASAALEHASPEVRALLFKQLSLPTWQGGAHAQLLELAPEHLRVARPELRSAALAALPRMRPYELRLDSSFDWQLIVDHLDDPDPWARRGAAELLISHHARIDQVLARAGTGCPAIDAFALRSSPQKHDIDSLIAALQNPAAEIRIAAVELLAQELRLSELGGVDGGPRAVVALEQLIWTEGDLDVLKALMGASYLLRTWPSASLEKLLNHPASIVRVGALHAFCSRDEPLDIAVERALISSLADPYDRKRVAPVIMASRIAGLRERVADHARRSWSSNQLGAIATLGAPLAPIPEYARVILERLTRRCTTAAGRQEDRMLAWLARWKPGFGARGPECVEALDRSADPWAEPLLVRFLTDGDATCRKRAADAISHRDSPTPPGMQALLAAVELADDDAACAALYGLLRHGGRDTLARLQQMPLQTPLAIKIIEKLQQRLDAEATS